MTLHLSQLDRRAVIQTPWLGDSICQEQLKSSTVFRLALIGDGLPFLVFFEFLLDRF